MPRPRRGSGYEQTEAELSLAEADEVAVEALGGRLDLIASFADHTLTVTTTKESSLTRARTTEARPAIGIQAAFAMRGPGQTPPSDVPATPTDRALDSGRAHQGLTTSGGDLLCFFP